MQVNPSYGVSPGNNGAAPLVAQRKVPGPGVSTCPWCGLSGPGFDETDRPADYCSHPLKSGATPSNLDSTRMRIVKRGSVVSYHGLRIRVVRVRLGYFWGQTISTHYSAGSSDFHGHTRHVQVVA